MPQWWHVLDALVDGRWWGSTAVRRKLPWVASSGVTALLTLLWRRGAVERRENPKAAKGVPPYHQRGGVCVYVHRITHRGRAHHRQAKAIAERLA